MMRQVREDNTTGPPRLVGDQWELEKILGSGSFAVVWKARHTHEIDQETQERRVVAIKEINRNKLTPKLRQSLEGEIFVLRHICHPNVVKLYSVVEERGTMFLVMEYCSGGDLSQWLKERGRVGEDVAQSLMRQLASGMEEMWKHNVVHRDLKPQNLLLSQDEEGGLIIKIADFGFARALGPHSLADTLCGSPLYMAPEILTGQQYDAKADLWSIGAILYEIVCGRPPYQGINQVTLLKEIKNRDAVIAPDIAMEISYLCKSLISRLLRRNPVERISFEEFFAHPFVQHEGFGVPVHQFGRFGVEEDGSRGTTPRQFRSPSVSRSIPAGTGSESEGHPGVEEQGDYVVVYSPGEKGRYIRDYCTWDVPVIPGQQGKSVHQLINQMISKEVGLDSSSQDSTKAKSLEVPWQSYGRCEFLEQVAMLLDSLGSFVTHSDNLSIKEACLKKLAYHLASIQLFDVVIRSLEAYQKGKEGSASSSVTSEDSCGRMDFVKTLQRAEEACCHAQEAEQSLEKEIKKDGSAACIPHWAETCHEAAQHLAHEGAAEELLGNYACCESNYQKAGLLLYFLAVESAELCQEEGVFLVDPTLLQRQATAVAMRWIHVASRT